MTSTEAGRESQSLLYEPIRDQALTWDRCFLCGAPLNTDNRTSEHIFPRWLLQRFELWNDRITLLNKTTIAYREMSVPSCTTCNNSYLAKVEARIKAAVDGGYDSFAELDPLVKYQWLLKIFYTILFRELFLLFDQRQGVEAGTILPPELLEEYNMCHMLLQSTRFATEFIGGPPWSLFCFRTHCYDDPKRNFDFLDNLPALALGLRLGDIAIIGCLEDHNAQEQLCGDRYRELASHPLHPIQFRELCARIFYQQLLLNRGPAFAVGLPTQGRMQVVCLGGSSTKPIYDEWDLPTYARLLSEYLGLDFDAIFAPPDQVMTWLYREDDSFNLMDPDIRL
jgi:hypothetical protein